MRILWIEDDPEITAELFFGKEILRSHDVLTIRDFEDAHKAKEVYELLPKGQWSSFLTKTVSSFSEFLPESIKKNF